MRAEKGYGLKFMELGTSRTSAKIVATTRRLDNEFVLLINRERAIRGTTSLVVNILLISSSTICYDLLSCYSLLYLH
jgi:hypothetical protein